MTEAEVATKAPESDVQEDIPLNNDAPPAEPAPKMGEHCTTDRPTPSGQSSTGELTKLGGVDTYISKPADYPHVNARLLLLLTGGTGVKSVNNQIQADKFATEGFLVVMPDLFDGDAAPNSATVTEENTGSILDTIKIKAVETAKSFLIDMWLARHTEEKVMPILNKVLDAVKDEFADAVTAGGGIYAVGYCFGGRYVLLLAAERPAHPQGEPIPLSIPTPWTAQKPADEEAAKPEMVGPQIKAGVIAHATLVATGDFTGLKVPVSLVCVENDPLFPDEVRTAGEDYMTKNNVEHEVQVYPGVPHGFAVVGEYADPNIKSAQATAFDQTLKWLKEH